MKEGRGRKAAQEVVDRTVRFAPGEEADLKIVRKGGEFLSFGINYRTLLAGRWHNVIRYDTAHGCVHRHRFWKEGWFEEIENIGEVDLKKAFDGCFEDVIANWGNYKKRMAAALGRRRNGD